MGNYIKQSDIENVFGQDNIAIWSNLTGGVSVDSTRITAAINYAEGLIDDTFRGGRYTIPFSPVPTMIKDWSSKLAGIWLFMCRPLFKKDKESSEGLVDMREMTLDEMDAYTSGRREFDTGKSTAKDVSGPAIV